MKPSVLTATLILILILAPLALAIEPPSGINGEIIPQEGDLDIIAIYFTPVSGADHYRLYQSLDNQTWSLRLDDIPQDCTTINLWAERNTTYYFYLTSVDAGGNESAPSDIIWFNTTSGETNLPTSNPWHPANTTYNSTLPIPQWNELRVTTHNSNPAIELNFSYDMSVISLVRVYRSTDGIHFYSIAVNGSGSSDNMTAYDENYPDSTYLYYYLRGFASDGSYSYPSKIAKINTGTGEYSLMEYYNSSLQAPTLLSAEVVTRNGTKGVLLSWTPVDNAVRYEVYRSTKLSGPYHLLNASYYLNSNGSYELFDIDVEENGTYYYYVVAIAADDTPSMRSNILYVNLATGETEVLPFGGLGLFPIIGDSITSWWWLIAVLIVLLLIFPWKKRGGKRK